MESFNFDYENEKFNIEFDIYKIGYWVYVVLKDYYVFYEDRFYDADEYSNSRFHKELCSELKHVIKNELGIENNIINMIILARTKEELVNLSAKFSYDLFSVRKIVIMQEDLDDYINNNIDCKKEQYGKVKLISKEEQFKQYMEEKRSDFVILESFPKIDVNKIKSSIKIVSEIFKYLMQGSQYNGIVLEDESVKMKSIRGSNIPLVCASSGELMILKISISFAEAILEKKSIAIVNILSYIDDTKLFNVLDVINRMVEHGYNFVINSRKNNLIHGMLRNYKTISVD